MSSCCLKLESPHSYKQLTADYTTAEFVTWINKTSFRRTGFIFVRKLEPDDFSALLFRGGN